MEVTPAMAIVNPDFHTIVHEIGCTPHNAKMVKTAPVIINNAIVIPINNLITLTH